MSKLRATLLFVIIVSVLSACGVDVQIRTPGTSVPGGTSTPAPTITAAPSDTVASTPQPAGGLMVGQSAAIKPPNVRDLWTAPEGGERVFDRPKLYSGALVTILSIKEGVVQVRTEDQVEGWIHAPAAEALTSDLTPQGVRARFGPRAYVQVVWPNGIPLRAEPRPDARKVREQVQTGKQGQLQQLLGDWLNVTLDDGTTGWLRWYYDDRLYVDVAAEGCPATPLSAQPLTVDSAQHLCRLGHVPLPNAKLAAIAPDNRLLAVASYSEVSFFSLPTLQQIQRIERPHRISEPMDLAFHPDGQRLTLHEQIYGEGIGDWLNSWAIQDQHAGLPGRRSI